MILLQSRGLDEFLCTDYFDCYVLPGTWNGDVLLVINLDGWSYEDIRRLMEKVAS